MGTRSSGRNIRGCKKPPSSPFRGRRWRPQIQAFGTPVVAQGLAWDGDRRAEGGPSHTPPSPLPAAGEDSGGRTPTRDTGHPPLQSVNIKGRRCPQKCPRQPEGRHPPLRRGGGDCSAVRDFLAPKQGCGLGEGGRRAPAPPRSSTRPSGHAVPLQISPLLGSPHVLRRGACPRFRAQSGAGGREAPPAGLPRKRPGQKWAPRANPHPLGRSDGRTRGCGSPHAVPGPGPHPAAGYPAGFRGPRCQGQREVVENKQIQSGVLFCCLPLQNKTCVFTFPQRMQMKEN